MDPRTSEISLPASGDETSETASTVSQPQSSDILLPLRPADDCAKEDTQFAPLSSRGDFNAAAALRAQYAIETPKPTRRRHKKATAHIIDDDNPNSVPIVDQTATIPLRSKKTERVQRKQQKRTQRLLDHQAMKPNLLNLPFELQTEIICYLLPKDIASLRRTSKYLNDLTTSHETLIAQTIIRRRYWTLYRCFALPIPLESVPQDAHAALVNPKRLEMLNIHRKSYHQHVQMIDPTDVCTCTTCVFAWNNLCLIVDLHHWQPCLENREPIPTIPRGTTPAWNTELLARNAQLVRSAIDHPIIYARILQMHLDTTVATILRHARWRRKLPTQTPPPSVPSSGAGVPIGAATLAAASIAINKKPRLYHLTDDDVAAETDAFLDRSGPPSYDFPYMRDNYYGLEAHLPNRRWSPERGGGWHYYGLPPLQHERDLEWVRSWALGAGRRG